MTRRSWLASLACSQAAFPANQKTIEVGLPSEGDPRELLKQRMQTYPLDQRQEALVAYESLELERLTIRACLDSMANSPTTVAV